MEFTHIDKQGKAQMVDVSEKKDTLRIAEAHGCIYLKQETISLIKEKKMEKGDVFAVAYVAGVEAAKKTPFLIPLCHPLLISHVDLKFSIDKEKNKIDIHSTVRLVGKTGAEMEALTAVSMAALTIYDMCKAVDKEMEIGEIYLLHKEGGKSGVYLRKGKFNE